MAGEPIKVLVVDDSALMRNLITKIVNGQQDLLAVGKAMNGAFALKKLETLKPDVIILDLEMPEMNGIEFLKERSHRGIDIPVIILSSIATKGAKVTMEALSLGASDFITKPSGSVSTDIHVVGERLVELIRAYGGRYRRVKGVALPDVTRQRLEPEAPVQKKEDSSAGKGESSFSAKPSPLGAPARGTQWESYTPEREPGKPEIIAIGISTGGPNALRKVFAGIPGDITLPVVVVQHMPAGFTEEFAKSLNRICPLTVSEVKDGEKLEAGHIYIAPGDKHFKVEKRTLDTVAKVFSDEPVNGHRPSVDVLFESIAKEYQNRCVAAIMTGMGKDGARQMGRLYKEGAMTLAQDEESSIVYGMPKVAVEHQYIRKIVPLHEMANALGELTRG